MAGCGAHAVAVHLRNARRLRGTIVSAISDPDPGALAHAARLVPDAAAIPDAADLAEREDVDAIIVATPPATHAALAARALEVGKHLYLEKPVGIGREEAGSLAGMQIDPRLEVVIGFNRRFHPVVVEAAALVESTLGDIVHVSSAFEEPLAGGSLPLWKRRRATGGGAPLDLASHHVDLVRHLLGVSLTPVRAELASVRSEHDDCILRFDAEGCDVEILCSFVRGRRDVVELRDEAGRTIELDRGSCKLTIGGRRKWTKSLVAARSRALLRPLADCSYRPSLGAWVDRIRGAEPHGSPASMADGLASLEAILGVEQLAVP